MIIVFRFILNFMVSNQSFLKLVGLVSIKKKHPVATKKQKTKKDIKTVTLNPSCLPMPTTCRFNGHFITSTASTMSADTLDFHYPHSRFKDPRTNPDYENLCIVYRWILPHLTATSPSRPPTKFEILVHFVCLLLIRSDFQKTFFGTLLLRSFSSPLSARWASASAKRTWSCRRRSSLRRRQW